MRQTYVAEIDYGDIVAPVEKGGTGAVSMSAAAAALKLVTQDHVSQPNGPIALDHTGRISMSKIPALAGTNAVNLKNNFTVIVVGTTVTMQITDYDSFKQYAVSASVGTISIDHDMITYTAPGAPGPLVITVAGREMSFNITPGQPAQPLILVPANGSQGTNTSLQFQSSAFQAIGSPDTHASSDWQLASDAAFTNIVQQVVADVNNKTTWTPSALANNTQYYTRVRHKGASGTYSAWSQTSSFTTQNIAAPTLALNSTISGQASPSFSQVIGTYTGVVTTYTVNGSTNPSGYSFVGGQISYNGDMPWINNGATLQMTLSNSGGSSTTQDATINLTPAPPLSATTQNFSFPVNQAIPTFTGGRKWVAAPSGNSGSVNSGTAPPGVSFSYNQGGNQDVIVAGTPSQVGTFNFTLVLPGVDRWSTTPDLVTPTITLTITP